MRSNDYITLIEGSLGQTIERHSIEQNLKEAVRYALLAGGKRVRPQLTLALCEDLGGGVEEVVGAACAIEILHAASLVHDDLPALDNDDMRRGQPSCHKRFGEATALLAADLMIALAFSALESCSIDSESKSQMTSLLSKAFMDLCSGQRLDIEQSSRRADLQQIHELKTGALFAAATSFGVIGSRGDEMATQRAQELGRLIGLGFQIVDDYLDLFGTESQRGRSSSSDLRNDKPTFFNRGRPKESFELLLDTQRRVHKELYALSSCYSQGENRCERTRALVDGLFARAQQICPSC